MGLTAVMSEVVTYVECMCKGVEEDEKREKVNMEGNAT